MRYLLSPYHGGEPTNCVVCSESDSVVALGVSLHCEAVKGFTGTRSFSDWSSQASTPQNVQVCTSMNCL